MIIQILKMNEEPAVMQPVSTLPVSTLRKRSSSSRGGTLPQSTVQSKKSSIAAFFKKKPARMMKSSEGNRSRIPFLALYQKVVN